MQEIKNDHLQAAESVISSPDIREKYRLAVELECEHLTKILDSFQYFAGNNIGAENEIISKGEKLACLYLSLILEDRGIPAQYIDLSDILDRHNIPASTFEKSTYQSLTDAIRDDVLAAGTRVPVITGYFGNVTAGLLTKVGRGLVIFID